MFSKLFPRSNLSDAFNLRVANTVAARQQVHPDLAEQIRAIGIDVEDSAPVAHFDAFAADILATGRCKAYTPKLARFIFALRAALIDAGARLDAALALPDWAAPPTTATATRKPPALRLEKYAPADIAAAIAALPLSAQTALRALL